MADLEFDEIVAGIEDGQLAALRTSMTSLGVRTFDTYSGDLDAETLKKKLAAFAKQFPAVFVAYAYGVDTNDPKTPSVLGRPLIYRHDCEFVVIVASNDARSEKVRMRGTPKSLGTYAMMSKVRQTLSGLSISKAVTVDDVDTVVPLTHKPLVPMSNEYGLRIPNITAYAIRFGTFFRWKTLDRTAEGTAVTDLILGVDSLNDHSGLLQEDNLPGVEFTS